MTYRSFVQNLPQLLRQVVIFSPSFFVILLLEERFVQVQALEYYSKRVLGPSLSEPSGSGIFFVLRLSLQFQFFKIWADQVTFELWWYFFFFRGLSISSKLLNVWA